MEGRRAGDPPQLVAGQWRIWTRSIGGRSFADIDKIVGDALAWERALQDRAGAGGLSVSLPHAD